LDTRLRIEELDVALNKANIKSAPGCDGFSYRFIVRFWDIYRYALFECVRESFETGIMPDAFRTASIRLKCMVDVSKAFDSVDHGYMEKVYQFYGLGPRIRKWLATIGTGRNAQILLANDELSLAFQLEKGHAQGDAPSPLLYNMAAQICIWKVELDPEIVSVYDPSLRANPDPNRPGAPDPVRVQSAEVFSNESNQ
jgi:hypothetical protein